MKNLSLMVMAILALILGNPSPGLAAPTEYWWDLHNTGLLPPAYRVVPTEIEDNHFVPYGDRTVGWPSLFRNPGGQVAMVPNSDGVTTPLFPDAIWVYPDPVLHTHTGTTSFNIHATYLTDVPVGWSTDFSGGGWEVWSLNLDSSGTLFADGDLMIRESPFLPSTGRYGYKAQPGGGYMFCSVFDIFTELSVDGGITWIPANAPVVLQGVPEPTVLSLLVSCALSMLRHRRTARQISAV